MPSTNQAVLDPRGYFFSLPTLGMPDPAGEWVPLKAAIAPLEMLSSIKYQFSSPASTTAAPLRTPPATNCTTRLIEYQHALWTLPKVPPKSSSPSSSNEVELFTVNVKRTPLPSRPDPRVSKLENHEQVVCLIGSTFKLAGEGPRCPEELSLELKAMAVCCRNVDPPNSGPRQPTAAELDIEKEYTSKEMDGNLFNPEWCDEIDLFKGVAGPGRKETHVQMRVHPQMDGDFRGMDYVLRAEGDFSPVRDDEWKPMPARAMLPGMQRCWVNMIRKLVGRGPLPPPPAPSTGKSVKSRAGD